MCIIVGCGHFLSLTFGYGRKEPPPRGFVPDVAANRAAVFVARVPIRVVAEDAAVFAVAHVPVPVISVGIIGRGTGSNATSIGVALVITVGDRPRSVLVAVGRLRDAARSLQALTVVARLSRNRRHSLWILVPEDGFELSFFEALKQCFSKCGLRTNGGPLVTHNGPRGNM